MEAISASGVMNMLKYRQYMPGSGWNAVDLIAHSSTSADAMALSIALSAAGDATAVWVENDTAGSHIVASHLVSSNSLWSQKELIASVASADGAVQALEVVIDMHDVPLVIWAVRATDGSNDTLSVWRNQRLTSMQDAQEPSSIDPGTDPGTSPGTDPGTGPVVDPGTIPESVNWTSPFMAAEMMHSTTNVRFYGPQVVLDDLGNRVIRMSMANINSGNGTTTTTINNHILRSELMGTWEHILMSSSILDDLSGAALIEEINVIPATGNLYALIRDGELLYLARFMPDAGWSKMQLPQDVPVDISRRNLQLSTNDTGMVTLTWHDLDVDCCMVNINAKHYMVADGWQPTETITVAAETAKLPRYVDNNGKVYASWLVSNPDPAVGGFDMKMATYIPMVGWSAVIDGPTGLKSAITSTVSNGDHTVSTVTDLVAGIIDAYVVKHDGTWAMQANINQKVDGDGVNLVSHDDVMLTTDGTVHFMVAWREHVTLADGSKEVHNKTTSLHHMVDATTGMDILNWNDPARVSGTSTEIENNLDYVLDSMGNAYAVWTSVDRDTNTDNVYVNKAPMGGEWGAIPEMLASYDMGAGSYALHVSITVNALDDVAIAWDQHMANSSMAMHRVWFVEHQ